MSRAGSTRDRVLLAAVLALLVGVYTWAFDGLPAMEGDSQGYLDVAARLRDGSSDRLENRPLGYPAFLVLTGSVEAPGLALLVTQLALHATAVAMMASLLRRAGAHRVSVTAFVGIAMLPPFVEHAAFVLSETLTQICVIMGFAGFVRWLLDGRKSWLVVAALALAAAPLVHMVDGLLWLALCAFAAAACLVPGAGAEFRRRAAIGAIVVSAVSILGLGGIIANNAVRYDYAGVSPMLGTRISHKTVRVLELLPDEYATAREILIRHRDAALLDPQTQHLGLAYVFRAVPELEARLGLSEQELSDYLVRLNLELIERAPMDFVDEVLRSAIWFWAPGVTDQSGFGSSAVKAFFNGVRALVLVAFGLTIVLLSGPTALVVLQSRKPARATGLSATDSWAPLIVVWLALGAIAYCCGVSVTLTAAVYRLRIPVDLLILACVMLGPTVWRALVAELGLGAGGAPACST